MNKVLARTLALLSTLVFSTYALSESNKFDPVIQDLPTIDKEFPPVTYEVSIPIEKKRMTGFILNANGKGPHPTFVLLHGLPGNEKNLDLAQSMRRAGFNILFFHYRGAWGSEGNYSFKSLHKDVIAAIKFLRTNAQKYRVNKNKISVIGHSFGGYAALRTATEEKELSCVVALSAANPATIARSKRADASFEANIGKYVDSLFMLSGVSGKQALQELIQFQNEMDTTTFGKRLKGKSVYMVVGEQDRVTPPSLQDANYAAYSKVNGVHLTAQKIPGDHVFSTSRILLQRKVVA
ncbi:MAG: alpha/beta fold hydrolase, partial [Kangiellaceae bacterium]|nr:alpha/beta fold hydrolase [Kangiellaceae bacterium]